jgi:SAM-dependent methyltransferase
MYRDHWAGIVAPHVIERDDGREHEFESAADYFRAPRSDPEREMLDALDGPAIDLGAGPGSYALYLQSRGLEVTAADLSPGAVEVCLDRGCRSARLLDLRSVALDPGAYCSIVVMGNTIGAHQTPASLPRLLSSLRHGVKPGGKLVAQMLDPLDTADPKHHEYHERNRRRGLPPGLTRIRLKYRELVDEWITLWMPTDAELGLATKGTGWQLIETRQVGPHRLRLFVARAT